MCFGALRRRLGLPDLMWSGIRYLVMLNSFQHPSCPKNPRLIGPWTLKQVQGDEK
jgi:hypothetical protein